MGTTRGVDSVTRDVHYIQGIYSLPSGFEIHGRTVPHTVIRVNVIDTIGLCDSHLDSNQVFQLIKDKVQTDFVHIDKVIICCSERLEKVHKDSINQFLTWLKYKKYKNHFCFFYTKTDGLDAAAKLENLLRISQVFGLENASNYASFQGEFREELKQVNAISFAPNASSDDIGNNRQKLMNIAMCPPSIRSDDRIPVTPNTWCTIL